MLHGIHTSQRFQEEGGESEAQSNPSGEMEADEHGYALTQQVNLPHDHWILPWERRRIQDLAGWGLGVLQELLRLSQPGSEVIEGGEMQSAWI
jgi:hypothetical protein